MNRGGRGILYLKAELNFHQMFEAEIESFERRVLEKGQRRALRYRT